MGRFIYDELSVYIRFDIIIKLIKKNKINSLVDLGSPFFFNLIDRLMFAYPLQTQVEGSGNSNTGEAEEGNNSNGGGNNNQQSPHVHSPSNGGHY
ncbi:MAG: hypothetical protein ISQ13_03135 [Candidatus Margulisbacteria bacterium]|nr:hypothetical protein [Candidatus Margulisiibacteriota bacterium]